MSNEQARLVAEMNSPDDRTLTPKQLDFMRQRHDAIEVAYADNNMDYLDRLAASPEYKQVFGDMSWDEAYDRYEETLWDEQFARSPETLEFLAREAEEAYEAGLTEEFDPDTDAP